MKKRTIALIIAAVVTIVFLYFEARPDTGFTMMGYAFQLMISGNSGENENAHLYRFDGICCAILFWLVYVIIKGILKQLG